MKCNTCKSKMLVSRKRRHKNVYKMISNIPLCSGLTVLELNFQQDCRYDKHDLLRTSLLRPINAFMLQDLCKGWDVVSLRQIYPMSPTHIFQTDAIKGDTFQLDYMLVFHWKNKTRKLLRKFLNLVPTHYMIEQVPKTKVIKSITYATRIALAV